MFQSPAAREANNVASAVANGRERTCSKTAITTATWTKRVDIEIPLGDPLRRYAARGYERGQVTQKDRTPSSELIP
jgi:hypothetical protein